MAFKSFYQVYIGTNSVRGSKGIYTVHVDADTLEPEIVSTAQNFNTGSLALSVDDGRLYAVVEGMTFDGYADGGVRSYRTHENGILEMLNGQRANGQRTCCVAVDETSKYAYACNFYQGTFSVYDLEADGRLKPARLVIEPPVDTGWKALHWIGQIDGEYIGVIPLAECVFIVYRADTGERITSYEFPDHPFPRCATVSGKYIYAMMQSPDDIYVFENCLRESRQIRLVQKISVMGEDYQGMRATSTIRATDDGRLLLAAHRPTNSVTVFRIGDGGLLEQSCIAKLPGETPRDFNISCDGKIVVAAMQKSDEICALRVDEENAALTGPGTKIHIPSPAAVAISRRTSIE